jgi:tetratricopeptide (TPR) repeat protein
MRTRGDSSFGFRHLLVQEAVYRSAPKRLRAELHERFADRLDKHAMVAELDELVGYHLEQAHRLRTELGMSDRRSERLAEDGGRRLRDAGMRAFKRGDMPAAANLLERAAVLLSSDDPARRDLICDLAIVVNATRQSDRAIALLAEATARASAAGDRRVEARARLELEYVRVQREHKTVDDLLEATSAGIPIFEHVGDHRALGRAWLLMGWASGGHRGDHAAWTEGAERALVEYRAAGWPTTGCLGELAASLYWGPAPIETAMRRCEELLEEGATDRPGTAYILAFLGGLAAQGDKVDRGRRHVEEAREILDDLELRSAVDTYCIPVLADIELLAGHPEIAESHLRALCDRLEQSENFAHLASRAGDLAEVLVTRGLAEEARSWAEVAERHAAPDDLNAQIVWRRARARAEASLNELGRAEGLSRCALSLAETTDDLNCQAKSYRDLGIVLQHAGRADEAAAAIQRAAALFDRKGNVAAGAQLRALHHDRALV